MSNSSLVLKYSVPYLIAFYSNNFKNELVLEFHAWLVLFCLVLVLQRVQGVFFRPVQEPHEAKFRYLIMLFIMMSFTYLKLEEMS